MPLFTGFPLLGKYPALPSYSLIQVKSEGGMSPWDPKGDLSCGNTLVIRKGTGQTKGDRRDTGDKEGEGERVEYVSHCRVADRMLVQQTQRKERREQNTGLGKKQRKGERGGVERKM
eukprot:Hpha_TRINITY_DN14482_c0_g1::TRINITY_DN14482_c0_g1_i1::g.157226::m.157226